MKNYYKLLALGVCLILATAAFSQGRIYLVSPNADSLWIGDSTSLTVTSSAVMSATGVTITGATGLDIHPCTEEVYVMLKIQGQTGHSLATTDTSGNVNLIGNTGDKFASIAFDDVGVLYGVTGDGATTPETFYSLNINTGAATQLVALGNGDDGECIAYNSDDGFMYHWSGNTNRVFERINLSSNVVTNINFLNPATSLGSVTAAIYLGNSTFGTTNTDDSLHVISTLGVAFTTGNLLPFTVKGLAFEPAVKTLSTPFGTEFCAGDSSEIEAYNGTSFQWYRNGAMLTGATAQQLTVTQAGYYNCVVNTGSCSDSLSEGVLFTELAAPSVTIAPATSLGYCPGDVGFLTAFSANVTYQWYLGNILLAGETSDGLTVGVSGMYNVEVTDTNGCSAFALAPVNVFQHPQPQPVITGDTALCPGDSGILMTSESFEAYQWTGNFIDSTLEVVGTGLYEVTITDGFGCTGTASVDVVGLPEPFLMLGPDTTICFQSTITLNPGSFASYTWSDGSTDSNLVLDGFAYNPPDTAKVWCYAINEFGCEGNDSITIRVYICEGFNELDANALQVYPNPAYETLRLQSSLNVHRLTFVDMNGRTVREIDNPSTEVDVNDLEAGVYLLMIQAEEGSLVKRVVIR